jgi:signal recognition particle receptor subunit beta
MNINWQLRELNLKVVYYGPALSGKTTNLEKIYASLSPNNRGELISLKTREDRTLFFDFLQIELGKISGLQPKIHLYTVPGQTYYEASRKIVLRGTDGVVFVADSNPERLLANKVSWQDLHRHLDEFGYSMHDIPVVFQCNKQDLPNAIQPQLLKQELSANGLQVFSAVAMNGQGVFDTLKAITMSVISQVQQIA